MSSARDFSGYLPTLLGPIQIQGSGENAPQARSTINFEGATITDDPDNDTMHVVLNAGGGADVDTVVFAADISAGQAVCSANGTDETSVLPATTANLANAGNSHAIAIEAGALGESKRIAKEGTVLAASLFGFTPGATADDVTINTATGNCVRGTAVTSDWKIGETDKQGNVTVRRARANELHPKFTPTVGHEIVADGTKYHSRRASKLSLEEFRIGGLITSASVTAAIAAAPASTRIYFPAEDIELTTTIRLYDDDARGNKHSITLYGPGGTELRRAGGARILWNPTEPVSTVVTQVSFNNPGQMRLGGWGGQLTQEHVGGWCWLHDCLNAGPWIVTKVHDSNTCSVYSPRFVPVSDAAASGAIRGRIEVPCLDMRARGIVLKNLTLAPKAGKRTGMLINVANPPGANASLVTLPKLEHMRYELGDSTASARICVAIGLPYVPEVGNANYSASINDGTATNLPRVADTANFGNGNCSEGLIDGMYNQVAGWYAAIYHGSPSAQSVQWNCRNWTAGGVIGGYVIPEMVGAFGHMDFERPVILPHEDHAIRTRGGNRPRKYVRPYLEDTEAFLCGYSSGSQVTEIEKPYLRQTAPHPSGAMIILGNGPNNIRGGIIGNSADGMQTQIRAGGTTSIDGVQFWGTCGFTAGQPARGGGIGAASCRGPFNMSGNEWQLDVEEDTLGSAGGYSGFVAASQVWQVAAGGPTFVDQTTGFNDATNANCTPFPAVEATGDYFAIGYSTRFTGAKFDYLNGTAGVGGAVAWEYWNGSAWTALTGVADATNGFTAAAADALEVTWDTPTNWVANTLNGAGPMFYVRAKVSSTYSTNPVIDQGFVRHIRTFRFNSTLLTGSGANSYPWPAFGITEVYLAMVAKMIRVQALGFGWGLTAWADHDQSELWLASTSLGATARVRFSNHARAGKVDAAVKFGLSVGTYSGAAPTALCTRTNGWVDAFSPISSPGTAAPVCLTAKGCRHINVAGTEQAFGNIDGVSYGNPAVVSQCTMGNRFSPPGGSFTMAAANLKAVPETRVVAGTTVRLIPTNAAAATLMGSAKSLYVDKAVTVAGTSFTVKTADGNNAAGTETFDYTIQETW